MERVKRWMCTLLAVCVILTLLPVTAVAEDPDGEREAAPTAQTAQEEPRQTQKDDAPPVDKNDPQADRAPAPSGARAGMTPRLYAAPEGEDANGETARPVARLTLNGTATPYASLFDAAADAQKAENAGCTVTLLENVDLGSETLTVTEGSFTLELNGKRLTAGDKPPVGEWGFSHRGGTVLEITGEEAVSLKVLNSDRNSIAVLGLTGTAGGTVVEANNANAALTIGSEGGGQIRLDTAGGLGAFGMNLSAGRATCYTGIFPHISLGSGMQLKDLLPEGKAFHYCDVNGTLMTNEYWIHGIYNGYTGQFLGGSNAYLTVVAHEHTFFDNKCECGLEMEGPCPHPENRIDWENGKCGRCQMELQAQLTTAETKVFCPSLMEAVAAAQEQAGAAVKMLRDVNLGGSTLTVTKGRFTLDLNGKTLTADKKKSDSIFDNPMGGIGTVLTLTGEETMTLTLLNSDSSRTAVLGLSSTYGSAVDVSGANAALIIGSADGAGGQILFNGGRDSISRGLNWSGGTVACYTGIFCSPSVAEGKTLWDLLPEGKAFYHCNEDGSLRERDEWIGRSGYVDSSMMFFGKCYITVVDHTHSIDAASNKCGECGLTVRVSVTKDGATTYYTTLEKAILHGEGGIVKPLGDWQDPITVSSGGFTLDVSNVTGDVTIGGSAAVTLSSTKTLSRLTVNGSAAVTVEESLLSGGAWGSIGTLTVNGGTVRLRGCAYGVITVPQDQNVEDILPPGYGYRKINDGAIDGWASQTELESRTIRDVRVQQAAFSHVEIRIVRDNTVVRGDTVTFEDGGVEDLTIYPRYSDGSALQFAWRLEDEAGGLIGETGTAATTPLSLDDLAVGEYTAIWTVGSAGTREDQRSGTIRVVVTHAHVYDAWADNRDGTHSRRCTVEGCTVIRAEKLAHTGGDAVRENEVAASCARTGSYDAVVYCTACGAEMSRAKMTVEKTGHHYGAWQMDAYRHWHACTAADCPDPAGSVKDRAAHDYDDAADADCNTCGYGRRTPTGGPTLSRTTLRYGEKLSAIKLSGGMRDGETSVRGSFEWIQDALPSTERYTAQWRFIPADSRYTSVLGSVELTVTHLPEKTHEVSGEVKDSEEKAINNARVTIRRGGRVMFAATTDAAGKFIITGVPSGFYNVVVTADITVEEQTIEKTVTALLTIQESDGAVQVTIPPIPVTPANSKMESRGDVPDTVVGGLDGLAEEIFRKTGSDPAAGRPSMVEVRMSVEESRDAGARKALAELAPKLTLDFMDISLLVRETPKEQSPGGTPADKPLTDTGDTVLEIIVSYDTDRSGIVVLRHHGEGEDSVTTPLTEDDSRREGTFFIDRENRCIHIFASRFSTYAIGYVPPVQEPVTPDEKPDDKPRPDDGKGRRDVIRRYPARTDTAAESGSTTVRSSDTGDGGVVRYAAAALIALGGLWLLARRRRAR